MTIETVERIMTAETVASFAGNEDALRVRVTEGAVLLLDKPQEWTSFDVVNKIRKLFGIKKVGHAGTLDPLATGLLIICTARMTKRIESFVGLDKTYTGTMKLGEATPSYDSQTEVSERLPYAHVTDDRIRSAFGSFLGDIEQIPPMYSAIKQKGRPLYKLARKGIEVARHPRPVTIHELVVTSIELPFVSFRVRCSKGTYIRTLAHDIGRTIGTGAHITELRRTAVGGYDVDDACTLDQLSAMRARSAENGA
jgi:tRNA pseudouridine55 synthase